MEMDVGAPEFTPGPAAPPTFGDASTAAIAAAAAAASSGALPSAYVPHTSLNVADAFLPGLLAAEAAAAAAAGGSSAVASAVRRRVWATRFLPEHVHEHYAAQTALTLACLPPAHPRVREIPSQFINILPLDAGWDAEGATSVSGSYGYVTSVYKGISTTDGMAYALRRVENVRAPVSVLDAVVRAWAKAAHPSIVRLRQAFGSAAGVGSGALFFVHDYYAGARSLRELYGHAGVARAAPIPERTLWSYAIQLALGLRAAHDADLTFRGLAPQHIYITSGGRLRMGGSGVLDVLEADSKRPLGELQAEDVKSLGLILLQLAARTGGLPPLSALTAALEAVKATYSIALYTLIVVLLSKPLPAGEVLRMMSPQMGAELDALYDHADAADELLGREADNGRLFRLLVKLGFVNERPSHEGDPAWAETGDRYLLKLYRDFLFHQTTGEDATAAAAGAAGAGGAVGGQGRAVIDLAHVVDSLNCLDSGAPDRRVLLSSRDGASLLVATYSQLRRALNASFDELRSSTYGGAVASSSGSASAAAAAAASGAGVGAAAVEAARAVPAPVRRARVAASGQLASGVAVYGAAARAGGAGDAVAASRAAAARDSVHAQAHAAAAVAAAAAFSGGGGGGMGMGGGMGGMGGMGGFGGLGGAGGMGGMSAGLGGMGSAATTASLLAAAAAGAGLGGIGGFAGHGRPASTSTPSAGSAAGAHAGRPDHDFAPDGGLHHGGMDGGMGGGIHVHGDGAAYVDAGQSHGYGQGHSRLPPAATGAPDFVPGGHGYAGTAGAGADAGSSSFLAASAAEWTPGGGGGGGDGSGYDAAGGQYFDPHHAAFAAGAAGADSGPKPWDDYVPAGTGTGAGAGAAAPGAGDAGLNAGAAAPGAGDAGLNAGAAEFRPTWA